MEATSALCICHFLQLTIQADEVKYNAPGAACCHDSHTQHLTAVYDIVFLELHMGADADQV